PRSALPQAPDGRSDSTALRTAACKTRSQTTLNTGRIAVPSENTAASDAAQDAQRSALIRVRRRRNPPDWQTALPDRSATIRTPADTATHHTDTNRNARGFPPTDHH